MPLDQLYPDHIRALEKTKLPVPNVYPALKESYLELENRKEMADYKMEQNPEESQKEED